MREDFENCCKRSFRKGQSAFARALDIVSFNFLRFIAVYFILRQRLENRMLCFILALISAAVMFFILRMVNKSRFERHVEKLKRDTEKTLIKQKLILMDGADYENAVKSVFKEDCIILHSAERVGADSVYEAVRLGERRGGGALPIISIEPLSEGAAQAAEQLKSRGIKHILAENLEGMGDAVRISDDDIADAIMRKYGKRRRKRIDFSAALAPNRARKYFSAGIMLLLLSFVMSFGIYIRFFASAAFTAAGFVFFNDTLKKHKNPDS